MDAAKRREELEKRLQDVSGKLTGSKPPSKSSASTPKGTNTIKQSILST